MRYAKFCEHEFVDVRTDAPVLPVVNVLAPHGASNAMTPGGRYRCVWCYRVIDLTARAAIALPEPAVDTRTLDPMVEWAASADGVDAAPRARARRTRSEPRVIAA